MLLLIYVLTKPQKCRPMHDQISLDMHYGQDSSGKNIFYALVNFEILGYMAFHNIFLINRKRTSKIHFEVFITLYLFASEDLNDNTYFFEAIFSK